MSLLSAAAIDATMLTSVPLLGALQRPILSILAIAVCLAALMFGWFVLLLKQY